MFNYAGNKSFISDKINKMIDNSLKEYSELFLGSGGIFNNLNKNNIKKYILNDIDQNIIKVWQSFIDITSYNQIIEYKNKILKDFGNIGKNKESYYNFRNWYNKNKWKEDSIESGIYLYFLFNNCINNMIRFGPNGFNQSYGDQSSILSEINFFNFKKNNHLYNYIIKIIKNY